MDSVESIKAVIYYFLSIFVAGFACALMDYWSEFWQKHWRK